MTGLPLVHLDRMYWRPNWVEPSKAEWLKQLAVEVNEDAWIMDGNYGGTIAQRLEAADTAIFLDFPRWLCLWRAVKRVATEWGRRRPDMADGCRERFDPEFFLFIWTFCKVHRPRLLQDLRKFRGDTIVLRSPAEVRKFIERQR